MTKFGAFRLATIALFSSLLLVSACGKKGDPKPPTDPAVQTEAKKKQN